MTKATENARPSRGDGTRYVFEALRRDILTLELKPGAPLDETLLARRFGLSRSPVREALNRLSAQSLVVMLPNRSTLVAPLDLLDFPRYVEALDLLQRATTRLAAAHRQESEIAEMRDLAEQFAASVERYDPLEMSGLNKDFHMSIARAGRNPYLLQAYERLLDEGRRLLHLLFDFLARAEGEAPLTSEHKEMVEAVAAKDLDRAEELAHLHTRQFRGRFVDFLESESLAGFQIARDQDN